jgi:hypothetical protein
MRYMIIVKASADSEAGVMPERELFERMGAYHDELARAGVLLDGAGLKPSREGWRIGYRGGKPLAPTDGPFTESKELIAGYTLIQVRSRDEALEWTRRFPPPHPRDEVEIEVRPLFEAEDFAHLA